VPTADGEKRSSVEWESPPRSSKNRYDWVAIAAQLKAHPLEWGKIFDQDKISVVNAVRQGDIKPLHPDLGFLVRTANNIRTPQRVCTMFLMYDPARDTSLTSDQEQKGK
jgi:hypothetical protein